MFCLSSYTTGEIFDKKNRIQAVFNFQSQTDQGDYLSVEFNNQYIPNYFNTCTCTFDFKLHYI